MRIGIVNDSPVALEALRRVLALVPQHQVVWSARNGVEALERSLRNTPDLILMDLVMPEMDGVETTRRIMAQCPCAIVVVTASVNINLSKVFEAMGAGALDAVETPVLGPEGDGPGSALLLAKIDMMNRLLGGAVRKKSERAGSVPVLRPSSSFGRLVVMGASAGGPAALAAILKELPLDFPAAVVVVQHVDEQFAPSLASWLNKQSALPVHSVSDGDTLEAGHVFLAVKNMHLIFNSSTRLGYTEEPKSNFYCPSVDVFFESVLRHWKGDAVGVLLTGMGRDGAKGLKQLRDAGFHTIAQDKATCAVYGMPEAAARLGAAVETLPLQKIAGALRQHCRN